MKPIFATIASFNRLHTIKQTVASILATADFDLMELNIVDDHSDKETTDWLKELKLEHPEFNIYLFNEWIPGVVKVLNFALTKKHPDQHWIGMDNDVVFQEGGWLEKLYKLIEHPEVGLIALKPPIVDSQNEFFTKHPTLPLEITTFVPNLTTCIKNEAIQDVGFYYDEYPWTGFDYDQASRVSKAGYLTGYYCTSRSGSEDYIDPIDLGRPKYFESKVPVVYTDHLFHRYTKEVKEYTDNADRISNQRLAIRMPLILSGAISKEETTCMSEFTNYEVL